MVIHDHAQIENWVQMKAEKEHQKQQPIKHSRVWPVVAIQSLACAVLVVLALLFRLVGGGAYEGLRQGFHVALERNELMTVLSRLWDEEPFYGLDYTEEDGVKSENFTGDGQQ